MLSIFMNLALYYGKIKFIVLSLLVSTLDMQTIRQLCIGPDMKSCKHKQTAFEVQLILNFNLNPSIKHYIELCFLMRFYQ